MRRRSVNFFMVWTVLFNTLSFCKSFAGSACLEIHNFCSRDIRATYVKNVVDYVESGEIKSGNESSGLVYNVQLEAGATTVCTLVDLGEIRANPTGWGTIYLTFHKSEHSDQKSVGVYTSGRSNFHVIVADNQEDQNRFFNEMFGDRAGCDQEEEWFAVQEDSPLEPLAGLDNE